MLLDLAWAKREENVLADRLSSGCFEDFDSKLWVEVDLGQIRWIVLDALLKRAPALYKQIAALKQDKKNSGIIKGKGKSSRIKAGGAEKLRIRLPWNEKFDPNK